MGFTPLYSYYLFKTLGENPSLRTSVTNRVIIMPALSLFMLTWSGADLLKFYKSSSERHLGTLSDPEVMNFENNYRQQQRQPPMQPQMNMNQYQQP
jgi:hypothetical protein